VNINQADDDKNMGGEEENLSRYFGREISNFGGKFRILAGEIE